MEVKIYISVCCCLCLFSSWSNSNSVKDRLSKFINDTEELTHSVFVRNSGFNGPNFKREWNRVPTKPRNHSRPWEYLPGAVNIPNPKNVDGIVTTSEPTEGRILDTEYHNHDNEEEHDEKNHFHRHPNGSYEPFDTHHLHIDPKILTASVDNILSSPMAGRMDLCSMCLCSQDFSRVSCEYEPTIANTSNVLELSKGLIPKETVVLQVNGYKEVKIRPKTFADNDSKLKLISFEKIKRITLVKHSFLFGSVASHNTELILQIVNSGIPRIPSKTLTQNVTVLHGKQGFKPEQTRFLSVEFNNCKIGKMESYAIFRARLIFFNISHSEIKKMERKSIDLDVYEMAKIEHNDLPHFPTEVLCLHAKKTVFSRNKMKEIGNYSIVIETDSHVSFEFNTVDYLRAYGLAGIVPMNVNGASIVFLMNHVKKVEANSLFIDAGFPAHERNVLNNSFEIECNCNISETFKLLMGIKTENIDSAYESIIEKSQCMEPETDKFIKVNVFMKEECKPFPIFLIAAIAVAILLFIIAVTVCIVCSLRVQRAKEEANMLGECTSQSFSTLSRHMNDQGEIYKNQDGTQIVTWVAAVPEMKTYQQNQLPNFELTESICPSMGSRDTFLEPTEFERRILARTSCPVLIDSNL